MQKTRTASEKPEALIGSLIEQSTKVGDMVTDFFAGTGVVADMCLRLSRNSFCTEKDEGRVENEIIPRLQKYLS